MSLSKELKERGFIHQSSSEDLEGIFDGEKRNIYHGIDPSSDSATIGNMVIWMMLKHLSDYGHKIVFLIGGGTGMIGDPKPDTERQLKDFSDVDENVRKIKLQAESFFSGNKIEFVNNFDWLGGLKLIDFLRDTGKHYTVNELMKKDAIATRLKSDNGLSYTEFAYPLLQGYDYLQLFETKDCTVQVGGSDQWGNIISGVELVRRKKQIEVFAVTVPLVIDKATGKKFGKSEGNAVWLDAEKTSPYEFYQFWLNVSDESAADFIKLYTLLSLEEVEKIRTSSENNPSERELQKALAYNVTKLVHSEDFARSSEKVSQILFGDLPVDDLSDTEKDILLKNAPTTDIENNTNIVDVLLETGLAGSKREARTFVENGAVVLAGEKVLNVNFIVSADTSSLKLIKRGKKNLYILNIRD